MSKPWRPEMLKEHFALWKMYAANLQELKNGLARVLQWGGPEKSLLQTAEEEQRKGEEEEQGREEKRKRREDMREEVVKPAAVDSVP